MPAKIKLTYFNGRGRAEVSRMILAHAGISYEDYRVPQEDWPAMKPTTPSGTLPLLEFNGTTIIQSLTIGRFLAKQYHLAGQSHMEEAQADMIVDCVADVFNTMAKAFFEPDETKKGELIKAFQTQSIPNALKMFEKFLKANGGKFFVGNALTWADLAFADFFGNQLKARFGDEMFGDHEVLKDHIDHVMSIPNIKKWVEKRPQTEF